MTKITENHVEEAALGWLEELSFTVLHGSVIAPEGSAPERESYGCYARKDYGGVYGCHICVDLYNAIVELRPDWHSDDDKKGAIKIVMTGNDSDSFKAIMYN